MGKYKTVGLKVKFVSDINAAFPLPPMFPFADKTVEAEQIRLNSLGPCADGGWLASNPFDACVMRRPKWYKSKRPMLKVRTGQWIEVSPGLWVVKWEPGEFMAFNNDMFNASFEPVDTPA